MNGLSHQIQTCGAKVAALFIALIGVVSIIGSGEGTGSGISCCGFEVSTVTNTEPANERPVARAGPDQFVIEGSTVTLVDSSFDSDGHIVSATWSQKSGPAVTLQGRSFIAPVVDMRTELRFGLVVQDGFGAQGFDQVRITVDPDPDINLSDGFIDFERLPNGELTTDFNEIGGDYSGGCVEFRNFLNTDVSKGPEYRRTESVNNTLAWDNDRTFNPPPETNFNITADFTVPVSSIEADVFADVGESITMTAFDSTGGTLGTITSVDSMACCLSITDTIRLSGIGEISTVAWQTSAPKVTVPRIDNLRFERVSACGTR